MADDTERALDRFLGGAPESRRTAAVHLAAHLTMEAWRQGRISTAQLLRMLGESREALLTLKDATDTARVA
jgi:hypothetical protein